MSSTTAADAARTSLAGCTAVVTGASRGIGAECARRLQAAGARVLVIGRDRATFEKLKLPTSGSAAVSFEQVDLSNAAAVDRFAPRMHTILGATPDIIVNNAGHFFLASAEETSVEDFQRTMQVNVTAPFMLVRALLPAMKARKRGHVVTIGSIADHSAFAGNAAYAASKYGVRGLHEVLRAELRGTGVRTTLVSPGPTDTDLWNPIDPDNREGFTKRAEMLSPAAVADAVVYAITSPAELNVDEMRLSRS